MTNVQEQDKRKGGRPLTGRVRKLSKSVTVKFSKPSYEALRLTRTIHIVISCITASTMRTNSYQTGMITGVMSR